MDPRQLEEDDVNDEVKIMIARDLLEKKWAENRYELNSAEKVPPSKYSHRSLEHQTRYFEDDDMNEEVKNMIALGLLDKNWSIGLNEREAGYKFRQLLSTGEAPESAVGASSERMANTAIYDNLPNSTNDRKPRNLQEKSTRSAKNKIFKLKPLSSEDPVFLQISADFKNCKFQSNIQSIQIVENEKQKKSFEDEKQFLKFHNADDFDLNLKDLYHSTNTSNKLICSHGLDVRLSRKGIFGSGIYFSDNVKKYEKYLSEKNGGSIYVCSVILGDMKEYPDKVPNVNLKTEPEKENGERYHSVKGNIDGYNEYVIYENRRSLIKYRIVLEDAEDEEEDDDVEEADDVEEEEPHKHDKDELDGKFEPILQQFMKETNCEDVELAQLIIREQDFDLENSVNYYQATIE